MKEIENQSKKVLERVEKARKDGKSQADAFVSGLKDGGFFIGNAQMMLTGQPHLEISTL